MRALAVVSVASATFNVSPQSRSLRARATPVETLKLIMATLWMCATFWLLCRQFTYRFTTGFHLDCIRQRLAAGAIAMTVTEVTDTRPSGPFHGSAQHAKLEAERRGASQQRM